MIHIGYLRVIMFGSILTPSGEAPMQDQSTLLSNPRDFALDFLNFVVEPIKLATATPADQLAAVDAASGVIPVLKSRLGDDLKTIIALVLGNKYDGATWRKEWGDFAALNSPEEFRRLLKLSATTSKA